MALAVCGAHLSGQPLNGQLLARGGRLLQATHSAPRYRLYVLPDGKRPAMVRDEPEGDAIAVEVWEIPSAEVGSLLAAIPAPLGLGRRPLGDRLYLRSRRAGRGHRDHRLGRLASVAGQVNRKPSAVAPQREPSLITGCSHRAG